MVIEMNSETITAIFESHGITTADFDLTREDDSRDRHWCPECNNTAFETARGIAAHYGHYHEKRPIDSLVDREQWRAALAELHVENELSVRQISASLPAHTGQHTVRRDLREFGLLREPPLKGSQGSHGPQLCGKLSKMSVEEFDAIAGTGGKHR